MFSEFTIKFNSLNQLTGFSDAKNLIANPQAEYHVFPKKLAPVFLKNQDTATLTINTFQFGLVPAWSKEPKIKFSTHNARIEQITEKPTWKKPLHRQHCIVPISEFREPVRVGPFKDSVIGFSAKEGVAPLLAAGIYDIWQIAEPQIHSFAIITRYARDFIDYNGHDREPLFLDQDSALAWLQNDFITADGSYEFLINQPIPIEELAVKKVRQLKPRKSNLD